MKKGTKMTPEQREKRKEAQKRLWANPEYREKMRVSHMGQKAWNKNKTGIYSEETIKKMKEGREKAWSDPELRKRQSELTIKGMKDPEVRKKISEAKKGKDAWNKGQSFPEWSGSNHHMFGKTHSDEAKKKIIEALNERNSKPEYRKKLSEVHKKRLSDPEEFERQSNISRKNILSMYESGSFPRQTNTKIERDIKEELTKRGYKEGQDFIHQFRFMDKFSCDFCFPKQKIIVEAYGDFWHANPKKYADRKLHVHQIKGINRDKAKEAYIKKVDNGSWTYLYFWESDIKENLITCVDKIESVIKKSK